MLLRPVGRLNAIIYVNNCPRDVFDMIHTYVLALQAKPFFFFLGIPSTDFFFQTRFLIVYIDEKVLPSVVTVLYWHFQPL